MKYFNGRILMRGADRFHGNICARTKAEAVRLGLQAFGTFNIRELNEYWSPCWGYAAQEQLGEQTEPGVFLEMDGKFFKFVSKAI